MAYETSKCEAPPPPTPQVPDQINIASNNSDALTKIVFELEEKLAAITRQSMQGKASQTPDGPEPSLVPAANQLRCVNRSLTESLCRLIDLRDRIEL